MDIDRYLARIGLTHVPSADPEGLGAMQRAHRQAIGFENLDIPLGNGIRIDSGSVFDKLVVQRRGGYCFEQNRLYGDALMALGMVNRPLLARVRMGLAEDAPLPPRTHVLLLVRAEPGRAWIADAGFGGSFVPPLPLEDGAEAQTSDGAAHRLRRIGTIGAEGGEWLLERAGPVEATDGRPAPHGEWQPQYVFDLAEVVSDDLEMANHWTSTRPGTRFTTLHVASVVLPDGFAALSERTLRVHRGGTTDTREIIDAADYAVALRELFGIALSEKEAARLPLFN